MLTIPGADRMQSGMQLAFGKSSGKAAIVKDGSGIFFLAVPNEKAVTLARDILRKIKSKIPGKKKIVYEFVKK
jgi:ribosomal protein L16/L10AE